jgi:hypothetical protein
VLCHGGYKSRPRIGMPLPTRLQYMAQQKPTGQFKAVA